MLKYKILYGVMLLAAVGAFVYVNTAAALMLLILMIVLPVIIKLSVMDNAGKIDIKCQMTDACVVGSDAKPIIVTVENRSFLPMGGIELVLEYNNHMFGDMYEERVSLCGSGKKQVFELPLNIEHCGRSEVEIKNVYCYDILNIMKSRIEYHWRKSYTVYPKLPNIQLHAQKLLTAEFGGQNYDRSRSGNDNSEVFQVRDYEAGDNLSAAHWKLSAKTDNIVIREWSRPNNFRLLLLFDLMSEDISGSSLSFDVQSAVMGITAAVSRELAYQGIGHNVSMINCGPFLDMSIHQVSDSAVLLDDMMSIVIPGKNDSLIDEILANNIQNTYSKLVYIGPEKNAQMLRDFSAYMDVTAIAVSEDGKTRYDREAGYTVYTISAKNVTSQSNFIEL
ncbi:MAG: DUF58 domain-containing protein [bacterium]|nr:DUF58 domain-containing protein [bacterium]